jgi:GNAT superfamily N-acetyltransferase
MRLRSLNPDDRAALLDVVDRCSARTLYERFLTHAPDAGRAHVHALLTDPDAYTAVAVRRGFGAPLAGFGSVFRIGPDEAEVALLVADADQGGGIGTALVGYLCEHAAAQGIARLYLTALVGNHRIGKLFRKHAPGVEFDPPDAGTVTATVRLAARYDLAA